MTYLFDRSAGEQKRLELLGSIYDPLSRSAIGQPKRSGRCLDIGAGGCTMGVELSSDGWIPFSCDRTAEPHLQQTIDVRADACELPFESAIFEAVHLRMVLSHIDQAAGALREAWRVLSSGGAMIVGELDDRYSRGFRQYFDEYRSRRRLIVKRSSYRPDLGYNLSAFVLEEVPDAELASETVHPIVSYQPDDPIREVHRIMLADMAESLGDIGGKRLADLAANDLEAREPLYTSAMTLCRFVKR